MSQQVLSMKEAKEQLMILPAILPLNIVPKGTQQEMVEQLYIFGPYLATRLGRRLSPMGFVLRCCQVIDDLEKGHDSGQPIDNKLVGRPKATFAQLQCNIPTLATLIFPDEFATEVDQCVLKVLEKAKELQSDQPKQS